MKKVKLIIDSSADQKASEDLQIVPLIITIAGHEFVDNENLDVDKLIESMKKNIVAGKTSCPSINDWLKALNGSERAIIMTITSGLSGSFSSAFQAKEIYEKEHPNSKVTVIDSRSAGPELSIILEEIKLLRNKKIRFVDFEQKISDLKTHTFVICFAVIT